MRVSILVALAPLGVAACGDGAAHAVATPADDALAPVAIVYNPDAMIGDPGVRLPDPIEARVIDRSGRGVAAVRVAWAADSGGSMSAESPVTDDSGHVRAWWTLGTGGPQQSASATVDVHGRPLVARFSAEIRRAPTLPAGELRYVNIETYDSTNQVVHPDVVALPRPKSGFRYFLAITPYPNGDGMKENPSIYGSNDGLVWTAPEGVVNPVARPDSGSYLSDPSLLYNPEDGKLWLYYRQVSPRNEIFLTTSVDGTRWSERRAVVSAPPQQIVSPSVVRRDRGDWTMFAVDGGRNGCLDEHAGLVVRRSVDGLTWSEPVSGDLQSPDGLRPWHVDVQWVAPRREFWAVFNAKRPGNCNTTAVYLATSRDGLSWTTYPTPLITAGTSRIFQDVVYRSTFLTTPGDSAVTFWYSGARYDFGRFTWGLQMQRWRADSLLARLAVPPKTKAPAPAKGVPSVER